MAKVAIHNFENPIVQQVWFYCPGCKCTHAFTTKHPTFSPWTWNGDVERPTFSPSLMCNRDHPTQCHCFVVNGEIQYQNDCHHNLKGKTVPMEEYEG